MKKEFLPYYISRALISSIFAILVMGFNLNAILPAIVLFGLFILYLHSGWFSVDLNYPLFPLHRDTRGQLIQRKAIIASVVVGLLIYLTASYFSGFIGISFSGNMALSIGVITYFVTQFILFTRV